MFNIHLLLLIVVNGVDGDVDEFTPRQLQNKFWFILNFQVVTVVHSLI